MMTLRGLEIITLIVAIKPTLMMIEMSSGKMMTMELNSLEETSLINILKKFMEEIEEDRILTSDR
jgi:hypothetical protein